MGVISPHAKIKNFLLDEIKEITLSEERNREKITKLKAEYREVINTYKEDMEGYLNAGCDRIGTSGASSL